MTQNNTHKTVSFQDITNEVRRLAKENPEYIYPSSADSVSYNGCLYLSSPLDEDRKPIDPNCKGCIFGQALQNLGILREEYEETEIDSLLDQLGIHFIYSDKIWIIRVQKYQDNGWNWSECIEYVDIKTQEYILEFARSTRSPFRPNL